LSTFPDGLYEYGGVPVGGARFTSPWATHWFVDGISGSDANAGKKPNEAKATVDAAVQLAGVGDIIYIRPLVYVVGTGMARYTEQVTVDLAQSNLSIIGVNYPNNNEFGPRLRYISSGYNMDVSGPALHLENIHFFEATSSSGPIILRNNGATNTQRGSDGFTAYNCHFKGGVVYLQGGQAGRFVNCVFYLGTPDIATGYLLLADSGVSGYNQQVRNCQFLDNNGAAPAVNYFTTAGAHVYNLLVEGCHFGQIPTSSAFFTIGGTLSTGMIVNCFFNSTNVDTDTDVSIGGTTFRLVQCFDQTGMIDATND